ncbi:hypothetical protein Tco_0906246 [Tanacetum coccineum]
MILNKLRKDKEMQKNLALVAKYFKKIYKPTNNNLRTSSNTRNKNVDTTLRYKNDRQFRNQRTMIVTGARETVGSQECRKPKRVKDSTYHKEKMLLCKQAEKGVQLQVEQSDWLADTDEEIDIQELEVYYNYMEKIQEQPESISNTCVVETGDSNVIPDSPDMCDIDIQNDQNAVECDDEHIVLYVESLEKEVDELESDKAEFSNMYDMLMQECMSNDVMCSYLHSLSDLDAHAELQCLYLHKVKECECLAQKLSEQTESVSKEVYTELL